MSSIVVKDFGEPSYLDGVKLQFMVADESSGSPRVLGYFGRKDVAEFFGAAWNDRQNAASAAEARKESPIAWAATYSAGSDAFVYRRFKGPLPEHVPPSFAQASPPARIVAFCEENNCDTALYDELKGIVRKPKLGTDEAP